MIRINGNEMDAAGMTLAEYLKTTEYNPARIAVERNGDIVPKAHYEETVLCDGDAIEIGGLVLKVIHTPGHTPGGISLYTDGFLFSGDTVFYRSAHLQARNRPLLPHVVLCKICNHNKFPAYP